MRRMAVLACFSVTVGCSTDVVVAAHGDGGSASPDGAGAFGDAQPRGDSGSIAPESDGGPTDGDDPLADAEAPPDPDGGDPDGGEGSGQSDGGETSGDPDAGEDPGDPDGGTNPCAGECMWPPEATTCGTNGRLTGRCVLQEGRCVWEAEDCLSELCAAGACGENPPGDPTMCDAERVAGATGRCLPTDGEICTGEVLTCGTGETEMPASGEEPGEGT